MGCIIIVQHNMFNIHLGNTISRAKSCIPQRLYMTAGRESAFRFPQGHKSQSGVGWDRG